ncbi:MAG: ABC transporter substrate-binding protein [Bacilli bacterium]
MKIKSANLLCLVSLLMVGGLTSCSSSEDKSDGTTKIIKVWVHKNETEDEGKVYKQIQNNFNNANLTDSSGKVLRMSMTFVGSSLEDRIDSSMITGGLPDIIAVDSSDVAVKVRNGVLVDFSAYVTQEEKDSYVTSVIEQGTIDGKLYSLSGMEAPGGLYYNKAMLYKVGYTDADFGTLENPWSFKDVHDAQIRLKAANQPYQIALNTGFGTDGYMYLYSPLVYSAGATFGTDDHVTEALTTDNAVSGIAQLEMFYSKTGLSNNESWVYSGTSDSAFVLEQIPFQIHGPWDARKISKGTSSLKDQYDIMPYPVYEDENGNKSNIFASPCGSYGFGITKDSKNLEAAAIAVKYLTGESASRMMYDAIGTFPTNKTLLSTMDELSTGPAHSLSIYLQANTFTRPKMVKYPQLKDAYGSVLEYIKNMNIVSNYNLKNKIQELMSVVDASRG